MKKSGQALLLMLFMLAGASDSVATDAAGAVPETHKRINLDSTQDSSKKTDPQNKKKPGLFNQCTQYAHDKVTLVQEYYNALDPMYQNAIKFLAILAAVRALQALHTYAGSSNVNPAVDLTTPEDNKNKVIIPAATNEEKIDDGTGGNSESNAQTEETTEQSILTQGEVNKDKDYIINFLKNGNSTSNGIMTGEDLAKLFLQVDPNANILNQKFEGRTVNITDVTDQYLQSKNGTIDANATVFLKNLYPFILNNYTLPTGGQ